MNISRISKSLRVCLIGLITVFACGSVSTALAKDFKQEWSGWFIFNSEQDVNGDLVGAGEGTWSGRGTFGRSDNHSVSDAVFTGVPCDIDPETGEASGVSFDILEHSNILRTRNGDQLFRVLSSSRPSTICFNFVKGTSSYTAYLDVVGGTGRFEGATGSTVFTVPKIIFLGQQTSATATEEGQIFGVSGNDDDDDDD